MDILRLILFCGLLAHKLLWEVLKRKGQAPETRREGLEKKGRRAVKALKAGVLVFLMVQTLFLDLFPIMDSPAALRVVGIFIYLLGLLIAALGRIHLGKNWVDLEDYRLLPTQSLVTHGIYRCIRHPIYAGDILLLTGLELALNSWLVLGVSIPLLVVARQVMAEEALLSEKWPDYRAYCARTKRFIPFVL